MTGVCLRERVLANPKRICPRRGTRSHRYRQVRRPRPRHRRRRERRSSTRR
jgi:hypothetical protein